MFDKEKIKVEILKKFPNISYKYPKGYSYYRKQEVSGRGWARGKVRQRDNYICQDCGFRRTNKQVRTHNKNIEGLKGRIKNLDVHHIDGECGKNSIGYDSVKDLSGMIALCHKCHYNRPEHKCKSEEFALNYCLS